MKLYIASMRWGMDLISPKVFKTRRMAERYIEEFILYAARDDYNGSSQNPTKRTLYNWADRNGYTLLPCYYWNGTDVIESMVTEVEV